MTDRDDLIEEARRPHCKECDHFVKALAAALEAAEKERADAWDEGRESVALDFTRPPNEAGMRTPTSNPYRQEKSDD